MQDDTKDKDEILESEFFDTRQAFLSLCQGNHYQYDTLRRAKHSSMMVLYHLHNPTAPAFVTTCNICLLDIETGQGWRCETCPEYDVCNSCYQKDGGIDHPHKLTNHPSIADQNAQNKEARQQRVLQVLTFAFTFTPFQPGKGYHTPAKYLTSCVDFGWLFNFFYIILTISHHNNLLHKLAVLPIFLLLNMNGHYKSCKVFLI